MVKRHYKSAKNRKKQMRRIAKNQEILRRLKNEKTISFLLGAGFSAPKGYPIGNQLNEKLLACTGDNFAFSPEGGICINNNGTKPDLGYKNSYDWYFDFCIDSIHYYNDRIKSFDYEEFYDYLKEKAVDDSGLRELFINGNYEKNDFENFERYINQIDNIYNQLVGFYLEDGTGNSWYDDEPTLLKPSFNGYTGFLNCVETLLKDYSLNVHTLNHDLFFERLNRTEWINGELCDGFEELGSPFYGKLHCNNRTYNCRLSRYTGIYNKKLRLYKLHGSKDYYAYYAKKGPYSYPDTYIKTRWGISNTDFYKEIKKKGKLIEYEKCSINYHPDFLTGTTSKIRRYEEPLLYKRLFELFKQNLKKAEKLIIIGYGCKDTEINRLIFEEFGIKKPCYIIDPYASKSVTDFIAKMGTNTKLIKKQIENLILEDFQ